ncbi:MAG: MFS transporter [Candidatus Dormibacteraeota bacterium]|nr:MFS transporter [Candidatus Dormibacteraeota bacterium]
MAEAGGQARAASRIAGREVGFLVLLWLGGFTLRCTLLAVPPVIPQIHHALGLDETAIGVLSSAPTLMLAAGAIPGALLIARLGARRALVAGLGMLALTGALRGAGPSWAVLLGMTFAMGIGIAVSQPSFPTLTGEWFAGRVGLATAVYTSGLLCGETLPAAFTGPLVLPALGGSWPLALAAWSAPVLATAGAILAFTPAERPRPAGLPRRPWWPDFGHRQMLFLGGLMGMASAAYFGTNTFLPDYLHALGQPGLKDVALASINASQLPASFLVLAISHHLIARRWPFVACGLVMAAALGGIAFVSGGWIVVLAGVIGFAAAGPLILMLMLPPILAAPSDVPRFSAGVFTLMYSLSFLGPVVGGTAWDLSGRPAAAFLALAVGGLIMAALAFGLPLGQTRTALAAAARG